MWYLFTVLVLLFTQGALEGNHQRKVQAHTLPRRKVR